MSDFGVKLDEARKRLPLRQLMTQHGKSPTNNNWKSFPQCPYCQHKDSAGVFTPKDRQGSELFKCHFTGCTTGSNAMDEVGFLQHELGLSDRREAAIAFMKEAGVWTERERTAPSVMPGQQARKKRLPQGDEESEAFLIEVIAWLKNETEFSLRALMRKFELGYKRATSVIEILEKRTLLSAQDETGNRTILPVLKDDLPAPSANPESAAGGTSSSSPDVPRQIPGGPAGDGLTESPPAPAPATGSAGGDAPPLEQAIEKFITYLKLSEKRKFTFLDLENNVGFALAKEIAPILVKRGLAKELSDGFQLCDGKVNEINELHPPGGAGDPPKPPNGGGTSADTPEPSPTLQALRWFYERLILNDKDRKELFTKRGLIDLVIDMAGFRSNPQSNKELLLEMQQHFPMGVLVESGLYKSDDHKITEAPKPNPQYYGMSIVERRDSNGKKVRDEDGEVIRDCVWNEPILIPYFNEDGELVHLRPHKGMMKDKPPQFYVARPSKEYLEQWKAICKSPQFNVITEGEFKAWAIVQVMGDIAQVGAIPGITMAKFLFADIEEWMETSSMAAGRSTARVVVGYDNEEKGDPKLPGYQEDEWKRFDSQAWARYLARQLGKQGYDGRVCVLPNEWRDDKGKADWDGVLAARATAATAALTTATQKEIWENIRAGLRSEFLEVVKAALPVAELWQAGFFDKKEERIIKNKLEKISYEPCLPAGGDEEQTTARRLQRLAMRLKKLEWFPLPKIGFLYQLATAYNSVVGRYYKMKPLSEEREMGWQKLMGLAREHANEDAKRACEIVLRGKKAMNRIGHMPVPVSDFYLKPQYVLHRVNGKRTRMVTLHNVHGANTELLSLPSKEFTSPTEFRQWVQDVCPGSSWDGGQNELSALNEDFGHELVFKDVLEVPLRGYHDKSKLWFFEDGCVGDDKKEFFPDAKTGIIWVRRENLLQGYAFARDSSGRARDREEEVFRQSLPRLHWGEKDTGDDAAQFFADVCKKLHETLGGYSAYMALGMITAAAAGPEIFKKYSAFPGLWVTGAQGEGKSSLVRWLIRIWGFDKDKGLPLPSDERGTLTAAALAGALGQYGELPLWLDEYQPTAPSWVRAILKNCYDRAEGGKKDFGSSPREFLSGVIVSGVATSTDSQTKSRFAHIQVSAKNRKANHYDWFQSESRQFYKIGRYILRHRKEYAEMALKALSTWTSSKNMVGVDDRARMVHGLAYAGFVAACSVFNVGLDLNAYEAWLIEHCKASAAEVQESVSVDLFWRELLTANESDAFGFSPTERRRYFKAVVDDSEVSLVSEHQTQYGAQNSFAAFPNIKLYFQPGPVIEMLRIFKRKSGRDIPIQQTDLRNQMKVQPYWVETNSPYGHKQRFDGQLKTCWCVYVSRHPLGLQPISDKDFDASFKKPGQQENYYSRDDWSDPRQGDLFGLIESLKSKKDKTDNES